MSETEQKYTDPELRERLKEEIGRGTRGGRAGQWSARKSQLLVQEYERAGGGYLGEKDEAARSLDRWTHEEWTTREGGGKARHGHSVSRYLPRAVWAMLSGEEQAEAERSKVTGSGRNQKVEWPPAVQKAMRKYQEGRDGETRQALYARAAQQGVKGRSRMTKAQLQSALSKDSA